MTTAAVNYAKVLYELSVPEEAVKESKRLMQENPELVRCLENPLIAFEATEDIIDRIFPMEIRSFLKVVCRHRKMGAWKEIFEAYRSMCLRDKKILEAEMLCVTPPEKEQLEGIRNFLCREFQMKTAEIRITEDKSLIGGFIQRAGGREFDWSLRGRYCRLHQKLTRR